MIYKQESTLYVKPVMNTYLRKAVTGILALTLTHTFLTIVG